MGLWSGHTSLKNVALRPDALYSLGLPMSIKSGSIELLQIDIPWRRLGKEVRVKVVAGRRQSARRSSLLQRHLTRPAPFPLSQGHKVVVRLSGVTAVVGSLHEDAAFTDDRLREWSWRRKQFQLQQLMEQAELADEAAELIAQEPQESQNSAAVRRRKVGRILAFVGV